MSGLQDGVCGHTLSFTQRAGSAGGRHRVLGMDSIEQLRKRLRDLEAEIAETKQRLPAHSVKPPEMMDLLELEDEYDALMKQVDRMRNDARDKGVK